MLVHALSYRTEQVKDYVGHSTVAVTEGHYLGKDFEQQRQMGENLSAYLDKLARNSQSAITPNEGPPKTSTKNVHKKGVSEPWKPYYVHHALA